MHEDFIHYLWKYKKFDFTNLQTVNGKILTIKTVGQHNHNSGPDFFNAQLFLEDQLWAGNVEIHLKSSDWYAHQHEQDHFYDNVILHVVWEHDAEIYRKDNSVIPTLELKSYIDPKLVGIYQKLFSKNERWINCENEFLEIDNFLIHNWLERLYIERLEQKSKDIQDQLLKSKNNWEATLFIMLAKNFGLKVNQSAFHSLAQSVEFSVIRKVSSNLLQLEALLFGQAGLLENQVEDAYYIQLQKEYEYLKHKFKLDNSGVIPVQFFRLRPANFPTIRLAQLASLYHLQSNLFSELINFKSIKDFQTLFKVKASKYWHTHYNFGKPSKASEKYLSKSFVNLLLINTIIPLKFAYAISQGVSVDDLLVNLISNLEPEKNSLVTKFQSLKPIVKSALQTQGLIQLKTEYCDKNKCLRCAIGNSLLKA